MTNQLHDPTAERDACGIGLVADANGRASRELVDRALAGLAAVSHRGAWAADGVTGDGAGLLLPLHATLTGHEGAGVAMCFLREPWLRGIVEEACRAEGLEPFGWRDVPHDVAALGSTATASMPRIAQLVLAPCPEPDAELRAHRARRRAERVDGVYVASISFRTVTYKALCAATQLASFYPDLADPAWTAPWAIFHQRFSTNTEPSWERAQPFRLLCHNGEINTIEGNVEWMEARERARGLDPALAPALDRNGSDSALLDNALELLVRAGLDVREAVTLLVPPAWQNDPRIDDAQRAMHRYHAMLAEPWDGPAGLVYSDGVVCGAALDRNGLRPLRVAVCDDGLVAVSSEAGAVPLSDGVAVRRARLGPGQLLSIDPRARAPVRRRAEARAGLTQARTRPGWRGASASPSRATRCPRRTPTSLARHALHGYTREELSLMLRPIAQSGQDPVYSMGDDAPIAPLAGRGRPLASYFRQRFAQVTNPAIDHYRERAVMSVATLVGARAPLDAESALPPLVVLPSFLVTPDGLAALDPDDVDATFTADEGLAAAVERVADLCVAARRVRQRRHSASPTPKRAATARRSRRFSRSRPPTGAWSSEGSGPRARSSWRATRRETRTWSRRSSATAPTSSARGSRSRPSRGSPRATRSEATGRRPPRLRRRLLRALEDGVLKVMSKMGISDVASYRGRAALRGRRARPPAVPPVLRRDSLGDRRDRARPSRARRAGPAGGERRREAGARESRLLQVPQGRRAACDRPRRRVRPLRRASRPRTRS